MVDMSKFIAAKSDQLNADDLMSGPQTITITRVTASPDAAEQPVSIHYEGGEGRPWKPCKTMRRVLVAMWGKDASVYPGRSLTLYRDPTVAFGGLQVGGIRVSHMSDIDGDQTVALLVTRGRKAPFKIRPLLNAPKATDFSSQLTELKAIARPGAMDELAAKWQEIGKDARRALAGELAALQAACSAPADDGDDVPFGAGNSPQDPLTKTLELIENAVSEREVDAIDQDSEADRPTYTQAQIDRLDEALATKRQKLREPAEQPGLV